MTTKSLSLHLLARVVAVDEEIISWLKRRERRQRQEVREEADPNKPRSFVAPEGIRGDRGRLPTASSITPCHLNIQASCSGFCTTDKSRLGQLYPDQADALAIGVMVDDQRDGALPRRAVELHDVGSGDGDGLCLIAPTWRGPLPTMMGRSHAMFAHISREHTICFLLRKTSPCCETPGRG